MEFEKMKEDLNEIKTKYNISRRTMYNMAKHYREERADRKKEKKNEGPLKIKMELDWLGALRDYSFSSSFICSAIPCDSLSTSSLYSFSKAILSFLVRKLLAVCWLTPQQPYPMLSPPL